MSSRSVFQIPARDTDFRTGKDTPDKRTGISSDRWVGDLRACSANVQGIHHRGRPRHLGIGVCRSAGGYVEAVAVEKLRIPCLKRLGMAVTATALLAPLIFDKSVIVADVFVTVHMLNPLTKGEYN